MTLPTTRIDTLSPITVETEDFGTPSPPKDALLPDFVTWNVENETVDIETHQDTFPNGAFKQNDLSNFTLVNLSAHNEEHEVGSNLSSQNYTHKPGINQLENHLEPRHRSGSSSSDDSDTGFLVQRNGLKDRLLNKNSQYKLHRNNSQLLPETQGYSSNPAAQGHRKRFRRRRLSTGTKRKAGGINGDISSGNDVSSFCCCDDVPSSSSFAKYLRCCCLIFTVVFIATFISILVSLQRKIDVLSAEVNKQLQNTSNQPSEEDNLMSLIQDLQAKHSNLNETLSSLKTAMDNLSKRITNVEKLPSVEEVRNEVARLGSDLEGSIKDLQKDVEILKEAKMADKEITTMPPSESLAPVSIPTASVQKAPISSENR